MVTCNLHCDMVLQCGIGDVQIALCMLHYAWVERRNGDLQFALFRLHYTVLLYGTGELQLAMSQVRYNLVQFRADELQFELHKIHYSLLQCNTEDMKFAMCHYMICYCSKKFVKFYLQIARFFIYYRIAALMTCNLNCTVSHTFCCSATPTTCNLQCAII
jgi:hypothetical protein